MTRCGAIGMRSRGPVGCSGPRYRRRATSRSPTWSCAKRRPGRASRCSMSVAAPARSGQVTGVDISEPMLGLLRQRIAERGIANLTPLLADAQTHAFTPASYDLVTSRFGVMFFADPFAAFRNLCAATKPGGRLCMAVWAGMDGNTHWKIPFEIAVRLVGPPKPQPPHAPGPMAFRDPDYL